MDRLEAQRLAFDEHVGKRLARGPVDHPARDLDQPRSTRVDDAGVAKDVEHLGRARQRILSAGCDRGQELRGRQPPVLRPLSSSAISRITVRIVPSTGRLTAR